MTPKQLRDAANTPWEVPQPGDQITAVGHDGRLVPMTVNNHVAQDIDHRIVKPGFMTDRCWLLAYSDEGVTWFRGWTVDISRVNGWLRLIA